jgi:hypothetical protein
VPSPGPSLAHLRRGQHDQWRQITQQALLVIKAERLGLVATYVADLEAVRLSVNRIEARDEALTELIDQVRGRLLAAEVAAKIQQIQLPPGVDFHLARRLARCAAEGVKAGTLGYALILASRDSSLQYAPAQWHRPWPLSVVVDCVERSQ